MQLHINKMDNMLRYILNGFIEKRCICFVHYLMGECNANLNRVASNVMINLK